MIPVFLESDFVRTADENLENIAALVRQQIRAITGSTKDVPDQFGTELFSSGRVLIIVDGLSERGAAVREFLTLQGGAGPLSVCGFHLQNRREGNSEASGS